MAETGRVLPHDQLLSRRADYPILDATSAYLINNSLGAMHRDTDARLAEYARLWATEGVVAWSTWFPEMTRVADLVGQAIGAEPGTTILRQSVSDAMVAIASCLDLTGSGSRIVTTAADWPGTHYFWNEHCKRYGGELVVVPFESDGVSIDAQRVADAVDDRTAAVSVSLVQFRTSALLDLGPIQSAARKRGALLIVDAYQAAGALPVDVAARDIDICVGGSVKFLCGGPGNGWLSVRADLVESLQPSAVGWISHREPFAFDWDAIDYAPGIGRFAGGTPNVPAAYAASAGYQAIVDVGVDRIRERSQALTQLIVDGALDRGIAVRSPLDPARRGGHVTLDPGDAAQIHEELIRRGFIVDYRPGSGIRVGPHFFTTEDECRGVIDEIEAIRNGG
ncbi:MAG TPA: aminotransferase class V-fold PLP-dependent enzyme [Vicinamibacterales bacterium]|nr:aminotransferase class V-fold PLP-dependent enzyme [Vicinamibacterales bacterium]